MNIKNLIENIIYIIVIGALLMANTYFVLKPMQESIISAINKPKTEVSNNIGKVKGRKSNIDLDMTNKIDSVRKKKWWKRKK